MTGERSEQERPGGTTVSAADETLPDKLLAELKSAQELLKAQATAPPLVEENRLASTAPSASKIAAGLKRRIAIALKRPSFDVLAGLSGRLQLGLNAVSRLRQRIRLGDLQRRYLNFLVLTHRHVFDRRIERLLFIKSPDLERQPEGKPEPNGQVPFRYQGPIPGKVLDWALSATPADLKRYAFADFGAGNGRTLLLAARRNFDEAMGYAFDTESLDALEMNIAQYSRSYMSCRNVRALRGDRDGIVIPMQPAVLFFPDSLTAGHLSIVLSHVSASQRLTPRPIYLVFENAGREAALDQMQNFKRVPLPILNRLKAYLFSPAPVAVYKSRNDGSTD